MKEIDLKRVSKLLQEKIVQIGNNVKQKRGELGMTQQSLAFYILTDKCVISNLERGNCTNVSVHTLIKIAEAFDIDVDDLILVSSEPHPPAQESLF